MPLYSQSLWQLDLLWQSFFLVLSIHIQLMPLESLVSLLHFHPLDFASGTRFNKRKRNRLKPIKLKSLRNGHKWPTLTWSQMTTLTKCNYIRCVLSLLLPKSSQPSWNFKKWPRIITRVISWFPELVYRNSTFQRSQHCSCDFNKTLNVEYS